MPRIIENNTKIVTKSIKYYNGTKLCVKRIQMLKSFGLIKHSVRNVADVRIGK